MGKEILIAQGLFSKLSITLNEDTINKLARIAKKDNPLAAVEADMKKVLDDFERAYFELSHPKADTEVTTAVNSTAQAPEEASQAS